MNTRITTMSSIPLLALIAALVLGVAALPTTAEKKDNPDQETFRALVVNLGGALPSGTNLLWLTIENWSTDAEREKLARALEQGGQKGLEKALRSMNKGYVRVGNSLRWTINHAISVDTPEGRKIRAVTERPITFAETKYSLQSQDYTVGIIEFTIPPDGKGEGVLIPAAQVSIQGKQIVVTTPPQNISPMQLQNVELYKK